MDNRGFPLCGRIHDSGASRVGWLDIFSGYIELNKYVGLSTGFKRQYLRSKPVDNEFIHLVFFGKIKFEN